MHRLRIVCLVLSAALCVAAADAAGQRVQGRVTDQDTGLPVAGAFVTLIHSDGRALTAILTDAAGLYQLTAPEIGTYRLLVERLGHASTTTPPVELAAGTTVTRDIVVPVEPVRLAEIAASTTGRCDLPREPGAQTQILWDEVRKALSVAHWAERNAGVPYQAMLFERTRTLVSAQVLEQETRLQSGYGRAAFISAPVRDLAARGYVRLLPDNMLQYFALDAAALLSDDFLSTHCFRTVRDERNRPGLVGLGFRPIDQHGLPDIVGTLWVDERTAELQHVEFNFTRHLLPVDVPPEPFGGHVGFRRLPNGAWIVDDWWLRMPLLPPNASTRSAASLEKASRTVRLDAAERLGMRIREEGGKVLFIARPGEPHPGEAVIRGVVWDSVRAQPLSGATVFLVSGARASMTNSRGEFVLRGISGGEHEIGFTHPTADAFGLPVRTQRIVLPARGTVDVELAIPRQQGCIEGLAGSGTTGIVVFVVSEDGAPVHGANVTATWTPKETAEEPGATPRTSSGITTENGSVLLCGFQAGDTVRLTVVMEERMRTVDADIQRTGVHRLTLVVR